jgi:hypothetical protein
MTNSEDSEKIRDESVSSPSAAIQTLIATGERVVWE